MSAEVIPPPPVVVEPPTFLGFKVKPKPEAFAQGRVVPEGKANIVSRLLFSWMTPLLMVSRSFGLSRGVGRRRGDESRGGGRRGRSFERKLIETDGDFFSFLFAQVGYTRPIEIDDIWELPIESQATPLGTSLERKFYARVPPSKRPLHLRPSQFPSPSSPFISKTVSNEDPDTKDIELGYSGEEISIPRSHVVGGTQPIADSEDKGKKGKLKPPKIKKDSEGKDITAEYVKLEENGKVYDQSLLRAINRVVFVR